MILSEIISQVVRLVSGGTLTDETRYDFTDIEAKIHYARANIIQQQFTKTKRISSDWTQQFISPFDQNLQESNDFVRFQVPRIILLDNYRDGFTYVGSSSLNVAYRQVRTRAELANFNLHRITKVTPNRPVFIYSDGYLEVYGCNVKELRIDGIFANPTETPSYNQDIDAYPLSEDLIAPLKDYLLKTTLAVEMQKKPDTISDSAETPATK